MNLPAAADETRRLERASWLLIGATFVALAAWLRLSGLTVDWFSAWKPAGAALVMVMLGMFYRHYRREPAISSTFTAVAQIILFPVFGLPLSYCAAALGTPIWDGWLHRADLALGLDWLAYLKFVDGRPWLGWVLRAAYGSLAPQMVAAALVLGLTGRVRDLRIFVAALVASGIVTVAISAAMPAMAMYVYLDLQPADYPNLAPAAARVHVDAIEALRSGVMRELSLQGAEGLITFPSYHAALGLIFLRAFWAVPLLRWPGVAINLLLIAATPIDGGHYFVDVGAGLAIAAACIAAFSRLSRVREGLPRANLRFEVIPIGGRHALSVAG